MKGARLCVRYILFYTTPTKRHPLNHLGITRVRLFLQKQDPDGLPEICGSASDSIGAPLKLRLTVLGPSSNDNSSLIRDASSSTIDDTSVAGEGTHDVDTFLNGGATSLTGDATSLAGDDASLIGDAVDTAIASTSMACAEIGKRIVDRILRNLIAL